MRQQVKRKYEKDIIEVKIISVVGEPGYGKSFLSLFFASDYFFKFGEKSRIFSNIDFFYKGKKINKTIKSVNDAKTIEYGDIPGLCIIDEAGQNVNARRAMTNDNVDISNELGALARKKNVSVVYISQARRQLDVLLRELSYLVFYLTKPTKDYQLYPDGRLIFHCRIEKKDKIIGFKDFNLFELLEMGFGFNTLEISKLEKTKKKKQKKEPVFF